MEKLIKLINEYGKTSNCWPFEDCRIEPATDYNSSYLVLQRDDNWEWDWKDWFLDIPRLISKEYWFIQRLIDNNKIDLDEFNCQRRPFYSYIDEEWYVSFKHFWFYEQLLMLLSIQDNPIELLIDCLK